MLVESGARVRIGEKEEGLPTVGGFWRTYTAHTPSSVGRKEGERGGKIILPVSAIEEIAQYDEENPVFHHLRSTPFPVSANTHNIYTFELSAPGGQKRSYAGVLEFTMEEGCVAVPAWMLENLQITAGEKIQVRRVRLSPGQSVKLQPASSDFLSLPDPKGALEWTLPHFVCLATGDAVVVNYLGKDYTLHVLEVQPGRAITIVDTNLNLEFAPPLDAPADATTAQTLPAPPVASATAAAAGAPSMIIGGGASGASGVSGATPTSSSAFVIPGTGNVVGSATAAAATPTSDSVGKAIGALSAADLGVEGVDYKTCTNCRRPIPLSSFNMHSLSCARVSVFCVPCGVSVPRAEKEKHDAEMHAEVACGACGQKMEARHLAVHTTDHCLERIAACPFCELQQKASELEAHTRMCGDRTEKCDKCNKFVQRRARAEHPFVCNVDERPTGPSSYSAPSAPRMRRAESLLVCAKCSAPFTAFDELQVHMLTEHYEDDIPAVAADAASTMDE